jgi:hypothetical protein
MLCTERRPMLLSLVIYTIGERLKTSHVFQLKLLLILVAAADLRVSGSGCLGPSCRVAQALLQPEPCHQIREKEDKNGTLPGSQSKYAQSAKRSAQIPLSPYP